MNFAIVSVGRNCRQRLKEWRSSILAQTVSSWRCFIALDPSDDGSVEEIGKLIDGRFSVVVNDVRKGCLHNTCSCIDRIDDDEAVVVCLDLDDLFNASTVLERLQQEYADPDVWLTYGSYTIDGLVRGYWCEEIPPSIWQSNSHRRDRWRASAMRTFKKWLFNQTNRNDFLLDDGSWAMRATDRFMMYPMLEMAGQKHCRYIKDLLYFYNYVPNTHKETTLEEQNALKCILGRKPYDLLKGKP